MPACVRCVRPFTAQASREDWWRARPAERALRTAAAGSCRCGASSSPLPLIAQVGIERLAGIGGRRSFSGGTARRVLISVRSPASCPGSYASVACTGSAVVVRRSCSTPRDSGRPPGPCPALAEVWIPSGWRPPSRGTARLRLIPVRSRSRCVIPAAARLASHVPNPLPCNLPEPLPVRRSRTCAASSRTSALGCVHRAQPCVTRPGCEASLKTVRWRG